MLELVVAILAVWRLTCYLVYEKSGQWVRDWAMVYAVDEDGQPVTYWGKVLSCFWCTSLHVGGVLWLLVVSPWWWVLLPFAISGGAILLNHIARVYLAVEGGHV